METCEKVLLSVVLAAILAVTAGITYYSIRAVQLFATRGYVECTLQGSNGTHWCKP